jgi:hypothetical protein
MKLGFEKALLSHGVGRFTGSMRSMAASREAAVLRR